MATMDRVEDKTSERYHEIITKTFNEMTNASLPGSILDLQFFFNMADEFNRDFLLNIKGSGTFVNKKSHSVLTQISHLSFSFESIRNYYIMWITHWNNEESI